uniref:Uncharacterized protein n=1 Tax=Glossina palpalis gambiensis TaxID=67801 RepID=A0A1B0BVG5_9MUSC
MTPPPQATDIPEHGNGQSSFMPIYYEQAHPLPTGDDVETVDFQEEISERRPISADTIDRHVQILVEFLEEIRTILNVNYERLTSTHKSTADKYFQELRGRILAVTNRRGIEIPLKHCTHSATTNPPTNGTPGCPTSEHKPASPPCHWRWFTRNTREKKNTRRKA